MNAMTQTQTQAEVNALPFDGFSFEAARAAAIVAHPEGYAAWQAQVAERGSKVGIKQLAIKKSELGFLVSFFDLHVEEGWNSRDLQNPENVNHILWLSKNIPQRGQATAMEVQVEGGKAWIRDGHSRYFGMALAITQGWKCAGVRVQTNSGADKADYLIQQIVKNGNRPFNVIEQANVYMKLIRLGKTPEQIAEEISMPVQAIRDGLTLLEADPETKAAVSMGKLAATVALGLVKTVGPTQAAETAREMVKVAEESGKKRATKGTLLKLQGKITKDKAITAIRSAIANADEVDPGSETEMVTIPREIWEAIKNAAKNSA